MSSRLRVSGGPETSRDVPGASSSTGNTPAVEYDIVVRQTGATASSCGLRPGVVLYCPGHPPSNVNDYLILRELDEPISRDDLHGAAEKSGEVLEELRSEGVDIKWVDSEVLTNDDGAVTGTFCHYQAESEDAVREHADRAGLPATRIDRQGEPLAGEE
ncbi:DUF4242 domain-containing protein [Haloplanus rallus]|uniref:DUF4242 domain-containing protein n=1 Tax=Haloplanus rallus TaxID=1816183 RepID=A0A6B9FCA0_9EURY|nr:DUF4242 domain-containing protein [Haloplanus rallus]